MKKIKKFIMMRDKQLHAVISFLLVPFAISFEFTLFQALLFSSLVGVGYEVMQGLRDNNFQWGDIIGNMTGIVLAALLYLLKNLADGY